MARPPVPERVEKFLQDVHGNQLTKEAVENVKACKGKHRFRVVIDDDYHVDVIARVEDDTKEVKFVTANVWHVSNDHMLQYIGTVQFSGNRVRYNISDKKDQPPRKKHPLWGYGTSKDAH